MSCHEPQLSWIRVSVPESPIHILSLAYISHQANLHCALREGCAFPSQTPSLIMSGTTSPSNKGPAFAPPQLSAGWIAQWDGASRKYSYIQLSTGVSQWEIPTQAVKTGNTPGERISCPTARCSLS
ncbi:uncharacterized protein TrAFT101_006640 [Trichoderma asperellum]|uniref:uncharacterized protein n=1 Tax=Trichoderma asperellum TaxID=101201 RepID=UPI0033316ED6|nr:hypothetical protein TrAFT101_006640 [Trichoderma asperellum]